MEFLVKAVAILMLFNLIQAAVYYVDPVASEGTRAKAAGTPYAPYSTIQQAADLLKPGDQLLLNNGYYFHDAMVNASGTLDKRIVIRAANPKQAVITGKLVIKGNYVRIEGLVIDGGARWNDVPRAKAAGTQAIAGALELQGTHADVIGVTFKDIQTSRSALAATAGSRVANCHFLRCNQNLRTASGCVIENNDFEDMRGTNTDNVRVFGIKVILRHNYIHGTRFANTGQSHVDCFQSYDNNDDKAQDILIEGNWCFGDYHQGLMLSNTVLRKGNLKNWIVRNNVFSNYTAYCITAGRGWGIPNVRVVNNLFINGYSPAIRFMDSQTTGVVKNNIFFFIRDRAYFTDGGATMEAAHNLLYLSVGPDGVTPQNGIIANPLFTTPSSALGALYNKSNRTWSRYLDKSNTDFTLQANSPCIDAGMDVADESCWADGGKDFTWDQAGNQRPMHKGYDIGPLEYTGTLNLADRLPSLQPGNIQVNNPFTNEAQFRLEGAAGVGNVRLTIFDQSGQKVQDIYDVKNRVMVWNGKDSSHRELTPGVYNYLLETSNKKYHGTLVKLH
jgi:hypothetical protein